METRANFIVIGAFTLAAVVGAFLFIMWIAGYGSPGGRARYEVIFNGSVSGLSQGALVLFNGLKIGEVTSLGVNKNDPRQVVAQIDVDTAAPIKRDTKARLETQGLTGAAAIALSGGAADAPPLEGQNGRPPIIHAGPAQLQTILDNVESLSSKADGVLDEADKLIAGNADNLHATIANAEVFSQSLADNAPGVNAALKSVSDLGKQIEPLAARLQTLSNDADRLVTSIDTDKVKSVVDNVQNLSAKANTVLDRADRLLAENSDTVHSTLQHVDAFSKALGDNASNVDATLKSLANLGKQIEPVAARIQTLSEDADRLVKAVDPDKVRGIVDNVQGLSSTASSVFNRADKLLAENSDGIHSAITSFDAVAKTLSDNTANIDAGLKGFADLSKQVEPVATRIQALSEDADRLVTAVDPDKIREIVGNTQIFTRSLQQSSDNFQILVRDGASLATRLNDTSKRLDMALVDVDNIFNAIDPRKISGMVDSASDVVETVHQNRGNVDLTLKNFAELSAKLNDSADKVDGVLTSAQSFLGSPGTKGAVDRISEAAESVKKLADDVDSRVKDIAIGLSRFSNSGLREYEALAVEGRRAIDDIDRAVRSLERNPNQLIFGGKPALPEYHGGQ